MEYPHSQWGTSLTIMEHHGKSSQSDLDLSLIAGGYWSGRVLTWPTPNTCGPRWRQSAVRTAQPRTWCCHMLSLSFSPNGPAMSIPETSETLVHPGGMSSILRCIICPFKTYQIWTNHRGLGLPGAKWCTLWQANIALGNHQVSLEKSRYNV